MERIFVIDDTRIMLESLTRILSKDYTVFALQDGTKTLENAKKIMPALILLDVIMPNTSGFDIIQQLKNDPETAEIPVIFITGLSNEADESRGFALGAADYITKPFRESIVKARVQTQLQLLFHKKQLKQEHEYSKILASVSDDIFWIDFDILRQSLSFSPNFSTFFHIEETKLDNLKALKESSLMTEQGLPLVEELLHQIQRGVEGYAPEFSFRRYTGTLYWYKVQYKIVLDNTGVPTKAIARLTDITKQKERIEELRERAATDPLTKLYNKEETQLRIDKYLNACDPDEMCALMIVDIDNFKGVNDTLGHQFGDTVLTDISERVRVLFRESDVVGRIGGDEFVIFMRYITHKQAAIDKAHAVSDAFRNTYSGKKNTYSISGSLGIAFYPQHGDSFSTLYRLADLALYESKRHGKDRCTIYHDTLTMEESSANGTTTQEMNRSLNVFFTDDLVYNIFEMLYETKDMHITLQMIAGILGKHFAVDRCYIFENSEDGHTISNTYEWCNQGVQAQFDTLQNLSPADLEQFMNLLNNDGLAYCSDLTQLDPAVSSIFARQDVCSFLICAIFDRNVKRGLIGFDVCHRNREWREEEIALLVYISRILSIFVLKRQISKKLWDSYQNHTKMLDALNGYVYVLDPGTHETLYLNNVVQAWGAYVGEKCHKIIFGKDVPCVHCPLQDLSANKPCTQMEMYIPGVGKWVNAAVSRLEWTGKRNAVLVCCTDISKYKNTDPGEGSSEALHP